MKKITIEIETVNDAFVCDEKPEYTECFARIEAAKVLKDIANYIRTVPNCKEHNFLDSNGNTCGKVTIE